jgi:hypothetical protein
VLNRHREVERFMVAHGALDADREYEMILKHLDGQ